MNELFTFLFDEDVLKNKLRDKWIKLYDFNFVDNEIINGLLTTKKNINDLLTFVYNKATASNLQSEELSEKASTTAGKSDNKKENESKKQQKKVTIPVPFKLSENKPRVLQEPIAISNKFQTKPIPLADYQKTNLKEIEKKHKEQLEKIKKNIMEREKKGKSFDLQTDKRPTNIEKITKEVNDKIESSLQFNNKYMNPLPNFNEKLADVKYNEAAIIREEYLIDKKNKEEENALKKILIEKKDSKEFERWQSEMKVKDDIIKQQEIEKRKIELDLNRKVATNYMQLRIQRNQLKAAEHKKQELINQQQKKKEKMLDVINKKLVIQEIKKDLENIPLQKQKKMEQNQQIYKSRRKEYNELNLIAQEEKKIYLERRDDLIRQIRELEKLPMRRTTGFDPTETPGYGLLEEMSLVELRERLALQKKMLNDEINSKKEENKLRMQERADELVEKAQRIQENRDRLRNMKEIERKMKKDKKSMEEDRMKKAREQSLFEVKQKIENKKQKLKKEDEIFQKKIREIKLQRQFLQLGRDAVEFKQYKQIEDGIERKITDKQNQDLINQLALEKIKWTDVKMKYNDAKKNVKLKKNMLKNYQNAYQLSYTLDRLISDEDKLFKKAVYDRERALNKYLQEDIKEKNRFCFSMQQKTLKPLIKNKSVVVRGGGVTNNNLISTVNDSTPNLMPVNEKENNEGEVIKVNEEEDEGNDIQNKLQNEKNLSQGKQAVAA